MNKVQETISFETECLKDELVSAWDPMPMLRGAAKMIRERHHAKPYFDGDYKDNIAEQSAMLFELLSGWAWNSQTSEARRQYKRVLGEAYKLGLLSGYDCPRATIEAWSRLLEVPKGDTMALE